MIENLPVVIFQWFNVFEFISLIKEKYFKKYHKEYDGNILTLDTYEMLTLMIDLDIKDMPKTFFLIFLN